MYAIYLCNLLVGETLSIEEVLNTKYKNAVETAQGEHYKHPTRLLHVLFTRSQPLNSLGYLSECKS